jgi:hypothetical protein
MNTPAEFSISWFLHFAARVVSLLTPIAWPATVFIIVLLFRKQIALLISKLKGAKGFGVEVVTLDAASLSDEFTRNVRDFMPSGNWLTGQDGKPGATFHFGPKKAENFYFFSHDLMLCYAALLTGAESDVIVHTLRSAIAHVEKIAPGTPHHQGLVRLLKEAENTSEVDWTDKRRRQDARKIWLIARSFGDITQQITRKMPD